MPDETTLQETTRAVDGTEFVRLSTGVYPTGANWKASLGSIFATLGGGTAAPPHYAVQFNNPLGTFSGTQQLIFTPGIEVIYSSLGVGLQIGGAGSPTVPNAFGPPGAGGHLAVGNYAIVDQLRRSAGDPGEDSGWFSAPTVLTVAELFSGDLSFDGIHDTPKAVTIGTTFNHTGVGNSGFTGLDMYCGISSQSTGPIDNIYGIVIDNQACGGGALGTNTAILANPVIVADGAVGHTGTLIGVKSILTMFNQAGTAPLAIDEVFGFSSNIEIDLIVNTGLMSTEVTDMFGLYVNTPSVNDLPVTITNNYGIYIEDQTAAAISATAATGGYAITNTIAENFHSAGAESVNVIEGRINWGTATNTIPIDGDLWYDGTHFYFHAGASNVDLLAGRPLVTPSTLGYDGSLPGLHYYVAKTGSDSNDGITSGTPFLTIQHALNVAAGFDYAGVYAAQIDVASGTYTEAIFLPLLFNGLGGTLIGAGAGSTTIDLNVGAIPIDFPITVASPSAEWRFKGFNFISSNSDDAGILLVSGAAMVSLQNIACDLSNMNIGRPAFSATYGGVIEFDTDFTVTGSPVDSHSSLFGASDGGHIVAGGENPLGGGNTCTFVGTPVIPVIAKGASGGILDFFFDGYFLSFAGAVGTGTKKFDLTGGSQIITNIPLASWPGDVPGTQDNWSHYDDISSWRPLVSTSPAFVASANASYYFVSSVYGSDAKIGAMTCDFTGDISGTVLTVSAVTSGFISVGDVLFGRDIPFESQIVSFGTGSGGVGTYNIDIPLTIASGEVFATQPKQTIVAAITAASHYDYEDLYTTAILVGRGTYLETLTDLPPLIGALIQGDQQLFPQILSEFGSTVTTIDATGISTAAIVLASPGAVWFIQGFKLKCDGYLAGAFYQSTLLFQDMIFDMDGCFGCFFFFQTGTLVQFIGDMTLTGNFSGAVGLFTLLGGSVVDISSGLTNFATPITWNIAGAGNLVSGQPFIELELDCTLRAAQVTWSGSLIAGMKKFGLTGASTIDTDTSYADWPGDSDGKSDLTSSFGGHFIDDSYVVDAPLTGGTVTARTFQGVSIIDPAGPLATLTVDLPPNPTDGQPFICSTTQTITALTVATTDGSTIAAQPGTLLAAGMFRMRYVAGANTWYP